MVGSIDFAAASDLNFRESFAVLAGHSPRGAVQRTAGATAFVTRAPIAMFNGCIAGGGAAPAEIESLVSWLDEQGVPYQVSVNTAAGDLGDELNARGLVKEGWSAPGMAMLPPERAPAPPPWLSIVHATGESMRPWVDVILTGGMPPELAADLFPPSVGVDPCVRLYVGLVSGRPVATSVAVRTEHVCGIYAVATVPEARRRGIGTAMTWAAARSAHHWGSTVVVLQASEMGHGAYLRMGFEPVTGYDVFVRDRSGADGTDAAFPGS